MRESICRRKNPINPPARAGCAPAPTRSPAVSFWHRLLLTVIVSAAGVLCLLACAALLYLIWTRR